MPIVRKIDAATFFAKTPRKRRPTRHASRHDRTPEVLPEPRRRTGISRIDHPTHRTHGWFARVYRGGKEYRKFFADIKHGGVAAALDAAEQWRDDTARQLGALDAADQSREG